MSMTITRSRAATERTEALGRHIAGMGVPCVGCENCRGLCHELIEAIVLPDIILSGHKD